MEVTTAVSLSLNEISGSRRRHLIECAEILTRWMKKWASFCQNHIVTDLEIATYVEALQDLSPERLENGCRECTKSAEGWPSPGQIRAAATRGDGTFFLGPSRPKYLDEPAMTESEREEALEFSRPLRGKLNIAPRQSTKSKRVVITNPQPKTLEEQREILRQKGYL